MQCKYINKQYGHNWVSVLHFCNQPIMSLAIRFNLNLQALNCLQSFEHVGKGWLILLKDIDNTSFVQYSKDMGTLKRVIINTLFSWQGIMIVQCLLAGMLTLSSKLADNLSVQEVGSIGISGSQTGHPYFLSIVYHCTGGRGFWRVMQVDLWWYQCAGSLHNSIPLSIIQSSTIHLE